MTNITAAPRKDHPASERAEGATAAPRSNAPMIAPPRLPYHPALQERLGVGINEWRALVDAVYPLAKTADSVILALSYCRARKLDPFKKPVHIVPMWNSQLKRMVETVWPGIGELRTTAFRTGQFAGRDEARYGETKRQTIGNALMEFPEWCQVTVYRMLDGQRVPFPGPRVYWLESYATAGRDDISPNAMWRRRPFGQIDKCAEAAALRAAFPEEVGNEYAAEEMEGKTIDGVVVNEAPRIAAPATISGRLAALASSGDNNPAHDPETGEICQSNVPAEQAEQSGAAGPTEGRETAINADPSEGGLTDDTFPGDTPAEAADDKPQIERIWGREDSIQIAYDEGVAANKAGLGQRAIPGEYRTAGRENELAGWKDGWRDEHARKGGNLAGG